MGKAKVINLDKYRKARTRQEKLKKREKILKKFLDHADKLDW
jgi:hypothetical protein